uniref:Uncharacterized protein n=1 Tax=Globodera rostochiensis TaxID=31243 RepID=A0A914H0S3_GLORO
MCASDFACQNFPLDIRGIGMDGTVIGGCLGKLIISQIHFSAVGPVGTDCACVCVAFSARNEAKITGEVGDEIAKWPLPCTEKAAGRKATDSATEDGENSEQN